MPDVTALDTTPGVNSVSVGDEWIDGRAKQVVGLSNHLCIVIELEAYRRFAIELPLDALLADIQIRKVILLRIDFRTSRVLLGRLQIDTPLACIELEPISLQQLPLDDDIATISTLVIPMNYQSVVWQVRPALRAIG